MNENKLLSGVILLLSALQLSSCTTYKKFFAANNHDYSSVGSIKAITTESKKFPIVSTDRFSVPSISKENNITKIQDFSPPNYSDGTELDGLPSHNIIVTK